MDLKDKVYSMFILGTAGGGYEKALKRPLGGLIFLPMILSQKNNLKS